MEQAAAKPLFTNQTLRRLIVPLLIEQVLVVLVGLADVAMVSSVGEAAVSGVSLVDMINVLILNLFSGMATGGAVVAAQLLGAGRRKDACSAASQLMSVTILISVAVTILVLLAQRPLLRLFFGSITEDVMDCALTYLQITALSYPFIACYNSGAALFRSMNGARVTMIVSAAMNVINIAGNAFCVYGLSLGVAGVAVPTLVSRTFSAVVIFILLSRRGQEIFIRFSEMLRPDFATIRRILYIGIPSALENSMFQLGRVLVR